MVLPVNLEIGCRFYNQSSAVSQIYFNEGVSKQDFRKFLTGHPMCIKKYSVLALKIYKFATI